MRAICLLFIILTALPAGASDSVSINFEVSADAASCMPALSNNGVVDYNTRSQGSLSKNSFTQLGTREMILTIVCDAPTGIAITARDTRASSAVSGLDDKGQAGALFEVNGGGYVSEKTQLFGLGFTAEKKAIGSYAVQINAANVKVTDGERSLLVDIAGAPTVSGPWSKTTLLPLPTNQDYFYTFVDKGSQTPLPVSYASVPLQVSATVSDKLNSGQMIRLDGEAVISIVYL